MRAPLALAALWLLSGCGLIAPFDLATLPGGDAGGDADSDLEAGSEADSDFDPEVDGEPDAEADAEPWDPHAGCRGGSVEERWAVAALVESRLRAYLTGRDCAEPTELCADCYPAGISPSGDAVLVVIPEEGDWRPADDIALVRLDGSEPSPVTLDVQGANPVWIDDDSFLYFAAPDGVIAPCEGYSTDAEKTPMRRYDLRTHEDTEVGEPVQRGWTAGWPAPSASAGRVAFTQDVAARCGSLLFSIRLRDLVTGVDSPVAPLDDDVLYFPAGLLPEGGGFVVQKREGLYEQVTFLYAASFTGHEARRVGPAAAQPHRFDHLLVADRVPSMWPGCGTVRRIGPDCELYCRETNGPDTTRVSLVSGDVELVECDELAPHFRIMDVWQR